MVLPCRVTPVLYPATCARYHSPIRYSRQTTNPKCSRIANRRWRKSTPGRHTRSEVPGRIG